MEPRRISFTTDYGLDDGYVAICHGVALTIAPQVAIIDVSHLVPGGDVRRGARVLAQAVPFLPSGMVHVAVVDPGVGTDRRAVAVEAPRGILVGPDNGLLPIAADALGGISRAFELTKEEFHRGPVSRTFHGRDIFMPVGAHLATGTDPAKVGTALPADELVRLPDPVKRSGDGWLDAEVLMVDRFGNLQTAAVADDLAELGDRVEVGGRMADVGTTFGSVAAGEFVTYLDSAGQVAVALNRGSAADVLRVAAGDVLRFGAAR